MTDPKPLKVSQRQARAEALASAAAMLNHVRFNRLEGDHVAEDDELTGDAWEMLDQERRRIVASLAKRAGVAVEDLIWESA